MSNKARNECYNHASDRQHRYAELIFWGARTAFAVMLVTYLLYITGTVEPFVPRQQMVGYLSKSAEEYATGTGMPTKHWSWIRLLSKGDYLNYIGIMMLLLLSMLGMLTLIPSYIKDRNWIYATIVTLELAVLLLAASGIVSIGSH